MNVDKQKARLAAEKEALQNCENAVIHDLGYIQAYGYLLAFDIQSRVVTHVSENLPRWFKRPLQELMGVPIENVFSRDIIHKCNNAIGHSTISVQREFIGRIDNEQMLCDIFIHKKQNALIIELQPTAREAVAGVNVLNTVQRILERLNTINSEKELLQQCTEELRALTGFNRVKAYRFLSDGAGEIAAESREPQIDSFLGLRFPSMDIPQAARKLYASTLIRIIPSVNATQIPILAVDEHQTALDLSLALFRGTVPVHVQYLQNMGVHATVSLPIVVNDVMWGLFAFHHMSDHMLDSSILTALELLGSSISMLLKHIIQKERLTRIEDCTRIVTRLVEPDDSALGFSMYWETASVELTSLIQCDGVALLSEDSFETYGDCPPENTVRQLTDRIDLEFNQKGLNSEPISVDSIVSKFPDIDCGKIAGVLAIPDPAISYRYLLYFRKSSSEVVHWAGKPSKDISQIDGSYRLTPRASFSKYLDSAQHRSDAFTSGDLIIADSLKTALSIIMSSITGQRQKRKSNRLDLLVRELNHRVRNILALVGSIVNQSGSNSHDIEEFVLTLEQRIQALSQTHRLLSEVDWQPVEMKLLLERALIPYRAKSNEARRITLTGENTSLPPELASLFTLIIHELAANALKYGALSGRKGQVTIKWYHTDEDLVIEWREIDGPTVSKPTRIGFGTSLIKESMAYEFDAHCSLDFARNGVQASFKIPHAKSKIAIKHDVLNASKIALTPKTFAVLLLEDDYVIAKEMLRMLKKLGAQKIDMVPTIDKAIECITHNHYDVAFLDANIRGEFSGKIAEMLYRNNTPFFFATGYGSKEQDLQSSNAIKVFTKPVTEAQLLSALESAKVVT